MNCRDARRRLDDPTEVSDPRVQTHLLHYAPCARLAARMEEVRAALRNHHAGVSPDPRFVARVAGNLTNDAGEQLGWAALRLLPGTVALALVLFWFAWRSDVPVTPLAAPTDNLLVWVATQLSEMP
jgi:hypothetical protein